MFANTFSNIGWTIAILVFVGVAIGLFLNARASRPEVGSEIELAPNRKPYYEDDELETTKLDRTLLLGLLFLGAIAVALPLYWLYEPARQEGAIEQMDETFVRRGSIVYETSARCVECHGPKGVGGACQVTWATNSPFSLRIEVSLAPPTPLGPWHSTQRALVS
jgi:hypothetical protein